MLSYLQYKHPIHQKLSKTEKGPRVLIDLFHLLGQTGCSELCEYLQEMNICPSNQKANIM
jgi:hypothetical protein